jgi:hypothetical protein
MKIDLGQTINALANIGVIAGIVFLAIELQQNNELQEAEVRTGVMRNRVSIVDSVYENPEVIELLLKDETNLTASERSRLRLLGMRTLVQTEWGYNEAIRGYQELDELTRRSREAFNRPQLNYGVPLAWDTYRPVASPRFVAWFEENVLNPAGQ